MTKLATIILGLAGLVTAASAQETPQQPTVPNTVMELATLTVCDTKEKMLAVLEKYGETPMAEGTGGMTLLPNKNLLPGRMMLWVNPETWSYSVTLEGPGQFMCMITSGDRFRPAGTEWNPVEEEKLSL